MIRKPTLLVIDDEPSVLALVERFTQASGFETLTSSNAREALATLRKQAPDLAIVDVRMLELGGLEVLRAIRHAQPECRVILMTAHVELDTAIEAVKLGAMDYLAKPLDFERLGQLLETVREEMANRAALLTAEHATAHRFELCGLIGRSPEMQDLFGLVRRIAPHARAALVTGETGVGKEGIARAVHQMGPRHQKKFVTINCSAVVETLFESELFGHARGAFTGASENKTGLFESADGGTLFLDEVGELPLSVQAKLLRVLETGEVQRVGTLKARRVDVRIVAATNRDLRAAAAAGTFRNDLFYRLNVIELHVPPLRDRREDIPYLVAAFVREFASKFGKPVEGISPAAERLLMSAPWPGNVRELRNVLERACMLGEGRSLTEADLTRGMPSLTDGPPAARPVSIPASTAGAAPEAPTDLMHLERQHILAVLRAEGGNKRAAAAKLGLSRRSLYRRLERHALPVRNAELLRRGSD